MADDLSLEEFEMELAAFQIIDSMTTPVLSAFANYCIWYRESAIDIFNYPKHPEMN